MKEQLEILLSKYKEDLNTIDSLISTCEQDLPQHRYNENLDIKKLNGKREQINLVILDLSRLLAAPYMCELDIMNSILDIDRDRSTKAKFAKITMDNREPLILLTDNIPDILALKELYNIEKVISIEPISSHKLIFSLKEEVEVNEEQ